jgi:hypothetical protein
MREEVDGWMGGWVDEWMSDGWMMQEKGCLPSAFCPLPSAFCPLPSALCPLPSSLLP